MRDPVRDPVDRERAVGPPRPSLEVHFPDGRVEEYPINSGLTVGRTEGDLIITEDPFLSGRHFQLQRRWGRITLHDLESTNGVFTQIEGEVELRSGDEIRIGGQLFRFDT